MASGEETQRIEKRTSRGNPFQQGRHSGAVHPHCHRCAFPSTGPMDDDMLDEPKEMRPRVGIRERMKHFTWAWFTLTMSTGGIALLLSLEPHRFPHLETIGTVVYVADLAMFAVLVAGITARFCLFPETFKESFLHPSESLFFPTLWLSLPTIIGGMHIYGIPSSGPWLVVAVRICFWIYVACTFPIAVFQYFYLFTARQLTVQSMTPAWILPIFPIMLSGTLAGIIAPAQPPDQRMPIIVAGFSFQSLGFLVAIFMFSNYLGRMMQSGLPAPMTRPGMFISVGPTSFTAIAYIDLAKAVPQDYSYAAAHPGAYETLNTMATFSAIFMWSLSLWFFSISLCGVLAGSPQLRFSLTWWSLVFPNIGFTIVTIMIGKQLANEAILWVGSIMTILLVMAWLFVLCCHVRAVYNTEILYPGKDEDA